MSKTAYEAILERKREVTMVGTIASALHWDQETYMPQAATPWRGEQLAYLSGKAHRLFADPEFGRLLEQAADSFAPDSTEGVNIRWLRRDYDRATKFPPDFVEECTRTQTVGNRAWVEAREKSEFSIFAPHLEKLVEQARKKADYLGYEVSRYDALLDSYEVGATTAAVATLFDELEPQLRELVAQGAEACEALPDVLPPGPYPVELQKTFNAEVAEAFGFPFDSGRVDTTTHPFSTELGPHDHRITNRYEEADFTSSLYCLLHETGHALYDLGQPEDQYGLPCGSPASLGIHESQSRFWENHIGRTLSFWEHWFDRASSYFPQLKGSSPEAIARHVNRVRRSFIRVESDEVTYDLHIILRFRLERALIEGDIDVKDIPDTWNSLFEQLMGLRIDEDRNGCLQDIHWSFGGFGYFCTYSLGNINAAQLAAAMQQAIPGMQEQLPAGQYSDVLGWLRENIHRHGRRFLPQELIENATGSPVTPTHHLQHLADKVALFS